MGGGLDVRMAPRETVTQIKRGGRREKARMSSREHPVSWCAVSRAGVSKGNFGLGAGSAAQVERAGKAPGLEKVTCLPVTARRSSAVTG